MTNPCLRVQVLFMVVRTFAAVSLTGKAPFPAQFFHRAGRECGDLGLQVKVTMETREANVMYVISASR
ncbi:hypothetical protein DPMN_074185 [Dreissena polymorpha]|uniref:Secreted protein n=1 Tax=Dreissena polymorpha TaxID=45954 RepID=A0A9D4BKE7_DREPO|nr:hypothetical protein DPMN_074185 [Dreissena polymorpha]